MLHSKALNPKACGVGLGFWGLGCRRNVRLSCCSIWGFEFGVQRCRSTKGKALQAVQFCVAVWARADSFRGLKEFARGLEITAD